MAVCARMSGPDVLEVARQQVLEDGRGLAQTQVLDVLRLPGERLDEALALAHEARGRWCGPEVEVEGIVSVKTGGCPEDCHFCAQSGRFDTPVRAAGSTYHRWSTPRAKRLPPAPRSFASWPPYAARTSG